MNAEKKITIAIPRRSEGNTASSVRDFVPLKQFEDALKASSSNPNETEYLLLLCGAVRDAFEKNLPQAKINEEIRILLEETGYLPKADVAA